LIGPLCKGSKPSIPEDKNKCYISELPVVEEPKRHDLFILKWGDLLP